MRTRIIALLVMAATAAAMAEERIDFLPLLLHPAPSGYWATIIEPWEQAPGEDDAQFQTLAMLDEHGRVAPGAVMRAVMDRKENLRAQERRGGGPHGRSVTALAATVSPAGNALVRRRWIHLG